MGRSHDEYELARRAREGDQEALSHLAERLRALLFAAAFAEIRHFDDAQDAVASALLRVCRHITRLRDPAQVRAWAVRIARNEARRLRTIAAPPREEIPPPANAAPSILRLDVERALRTLPTDQARAIALFYLDGIPIRAVAEQVQRPEGTVKYWLSRGRAPLAQHMEGYAPMETTSANTEIRWTAAIVSTEIAPELLRQMSDAMRASGWEDVRLVSDIAAAGALERPAPNATSTVRNLPAPLTGCRCIVLDEWIGGHSAFELSLLLRASDEGRGAALFLLIDGNRPEAEIDNTALAAYMTGFDMALTKPFDLAEFQGFSRRLREHLAK
jgi:RNA polymerase sigma-70 factor (ECF subfamily)